MLALRVQGVARYFGPRVELDGAARPREAWRALLRIAGLDLRDLTDANTQRTMVVAGHVLRDVTFDVERGSVVCLAGPSGAGKSVLLQILAGVIAPTAGRIERYGAVSSLLGIDADLDELDTARANVRRSPRCPKDEAGAARFADEVIAFAELHGFEDVPVRTYSTGMQVRLGVALALCGRPDIVLLDDVLAVGDIAFQQKCVERIHELKAEGATIVAVFGDDRLVHQLATRVVTLGGGRVVADGPAVAWTHTPTRGGAADVDWQVTQDLPEDDAVALRSVTVDAVRDGDETHVDVAMTFEAKVDGVECRPSVFLNRGKTTIFRSLAPDVLRLGASRRVRWDVRIPAGLLPDGAYALMLNMQSLHGGLVYAMKAQDAVTLTVRRDAGAGEPPPDDAVTPLLAVRFPWEIERLEAGGHA